MSHFLSPQLCDDHESTLTSQALDEMYVDTKNSFKKRFDGLETEYFKTFFQKRLEKEILGWYNSYCQKPGPKAQQVAKAIKGAYHALGQGDVRGVVEGATAAQSALVTALYSGGKGMFAWLFS